MCDVSAGGTLPISCSDGYLILAPGTAPSVMYDSVADAWTTFQVASCALRMLVQYCRVHRSHGCLSSKVTLPSVCHDLHPHIAALAR